MQIQDFTILAMSIKAPVLIIKTNAGYTAKVENKGSVDDVHCTTQRGKLRAWASIDRLVKALADRRYVGCVELRVDHQQPLI